MFRCVALLYKFSKRERFVFKGIQMLNCFAIMSFGVWHLLSIKKKSIEVLYIFTLLIWRREFFAAMSRLDASNKFTGISSGYMLLGGHHHKMGWHVEKPQKGGVE